MSNLFAKIIETGLTDEQRFNLKQMQMHKKKRNEDEMSDEAYGILCESILIVHWETEIDTLSNYINQLPGDADLQFFSSLQKKLYELRTQLCVLRNR